MTRLEKLLQDPDRIITTIINSIGSQQDDGGIQEDTL